MGYTHYWSFNAPERKKGAADAADKLYKQAIKDCTTVVKAYQKNAHDWERLSGFTAHAPAGKYGGLQVNGKQDAGHESFDLREHFRQALEESFNFCKTAQKPYDVVVVACLCILKYRLKSLVSVDSDGDQQDWQAGAGFAAHVLKRKIEVPKSIRPNPALKLVAGGQK